MRLEELIKGMTVLGLRGAADAEVSELVYDARRATPGSCFFAIRGTRHDGNDFVEAAMNRGASVVVSERPVGRDLDVINVVVHDSRAAMGHMASRLYGEPSGELTVVGITGTNGKTTTAYMIESILRSAGREPGVLGTVEYRFGGMSEKAPHTTPFSLDLQRLLRRMRESGCDSCAMEVSSHALEQSRVAGCRFDAGVFTNLSPEHLDYHDGMESYFSAKSILFDRVLAESAKPEAFAVINADDDYGLRMASRCAVPAMLYGFSDKADVRGEALSLNQSGIAMRIKMRERAFDVCSKLCGSFNAMNALAATAVALGLGVKPKDIVSGLDALCCVPGRFEAVPNDRGVLALVDYAHTPDALRNALAHARELLAESGGRLLAVFGCGGDRDRAKRPLMGSVAAELADVVLVTSDNPRTEDPARIIEEILPGVTGRACPFDGDMGYEVVSDRRQAIHRGVELARPGDVLVVAGKGHEDYQILGDERIRFDDREELAGALRV